MSVPQQPKATESRAHVEGAPASARDRISRPRLAVASASPNPHQRHINPVCRSTAHDPRDDQESTPSANASRGKSALISDADRDKSPRDRAPGRGKNSLNSKYSLNRDADCGKNSLEGDTASGETSL